MQTKTCIKNLKNFIIVATVALISVGCGGGSSDGAGTDPGFSDNLSGVWNGALSITGGGTGPLNVTINQPVSGSVISIRNAVNLSGTVNVFGDSFAMIGTKDGNNVTMQITEGSATLTMTGALSSENSMNGTFQITGPGPKDTGTWFLTR